MGTTGMSIIFLQSIIIICKQHINITILYYKKYQIIFPPNVIIVKYVCSKVKSLLNNIIIWNIVSGNILY